MNTFKEIETTTLTLDEFQNDERDLKSSFDIKFLLLEEDISVFETGRILQIHTRFLVKSILEVFQQTKHVLIQKIEIIRELIFIVQIH